MPLLTKSHVSSFTMTIRETVLRQQTPTQSLCYTHVSPRAGSKAALGETQLWHMEEVPKPSSSSWMSLFSLFSGRDGYWIQAGRMSAYMALKFTSQAKRIVCQVFDCCNHCLDQHLQRLHSFHNIWFCESLWDRLCWLLYFTCAGFFLFLHCAQRDHLRPVITYPQHILLLFYTILLQSLISLWKKWAFLLSCIGGNKAVYFFLKGWIDSQ